MKLTTRPILALALVAGLSGLGGLSAASADSSAASCALVTDKAGDAGATTAASAGPSDDALDFTYINLASDATKLTGVFGLTKAAEKAASAPNGFQLLLNFTAPGAANELYLNATGSSRTGMAFNFGENQPTVGLHTLGAASGVVDTVKNEIRVSVKLKDLKAAGVKLTPGMKLTQINAISSRDLVLFIIYSDKAMGGKDYTVGAPSCVTVGK